VFVCELLKGRFASSDELGVVTLTEHDSTNLIGFSTAPGTLFPERCVARGGSTNRHLGDPFLLLFVKVDAAFTLGIHVLLTTNFGSFVPQ
jgi:hypothetical protein